MITRLVEKPGSRHATVDVDGREYEYTLLAVSNNGLEDEDTVVATPGVPRGGTPYINRSSIDAEARCTSVSVDRVDKLVWEVICRYSSKAGDKKTPEAHGKQKQNPEKPLTWPTEIHWGSRRIEVYSRFDAMKRPFLNSAGDPLRDLPPLEIYHGLVTLSRMETKYNPVAASQYAGKVNSNTWFACPPNTAKCEWPEATLTYVDTIDRYFWKITYAFEIAPEGWEVLSKNNKDHPRAIADRGRQCFPGESANLPKGTKVQTTDTFGVASGDEAFLDGAGRQLSNTYLAQYGPIMLRPFTFYKTANFNALRLP